MHFLALALLATAAPTEIVLPPSFGSAPRAQEGPDVAWSSSARTFLVAWREWSARGSVVAARVDASGKVLDPTGIVIDDDVFKVEPAVRVAACGDVFVLVWASHEGAPVVRARRVDASGHALDSRPLAVSPPGMDARAAVVACSERTAMVAFMVYGTSDIAARSLDVASGQLGPVGVLERGPQHRWPSSLDLGFDGAAFRAVWGLHDGRGGVALRTARFKSPADAEGQEIAATTTTSFALRLAMLPGGAFAVVQRRQGPQGDEGWIVSRFAAGRKVADVRLGGKDEGLGDVVVDGGDVVVVLQRWVGEGLGPSLLRVRGDDVRGLVQRGPGLLSLPRVHQAGSWRLGAAALAAGSDRLFAVWPTPVPLAPNTMVATPLEPVDVDILGVAVDRASLALLRRDEVPVRVSTGPVLRRLPRAALMGGRGLVTWLEGEAAELRASTVEPQTRRASAPVSLGVVARDRYAVVPRRGGFVVAVAEARGLRLVRLDGRGAVVGEPVRYEGLMTFALAFDGTSVWLASAEEKSVVARRLDDELAVAGEPVTFRADVRPNAVALQCAAPSDCALAWREESYGQIRLVRVPGSEDLRRHGRAPVVAQGGGLELVALAGGYALGFTEGRDAKVRRFGRDLGPKGAAECVSCGLPQGSMEGPGVPAPTPGGALVDVWLEGRRVLYAKDGWFSTTKRGRGARPAVAVDGGRRLEVWEAGDSVAVWLVE